MPTAVGREREGDDEEGERGKRGMEKGEGSSGWNSNDKE